MYLGKREYISVNGSLENIHGIVHVPNLEKLKGRVIYASLSITFRYGREEDEMMGLSMAKEVPVDRVLIFPLKNDKGMFINHMDTKF